MDNDGQITSSKELFGEFDIDGQKKFADGYEKLAHHFDKDRNGKVEGAELAGFKVWKDGSADGKVQDGELQSLGQHNINSFDVANINRNDMSSTLLHHLTGLRIALDLADLVAFLVEVTGGRLLVVLLALERLAVGVVDQALAPLVVVRRGAVLKDDLAAGDLGRAAAGTPSDALELPGILAGIPVIEPAPPNAP
ncbi:MAG: hypothetical protein FJX76_13675 [Armatimonadetes bacterium]|nr:hypothetical protein [Armatimonadota bacterium]